MFVKRTLRRSQARSHPHGLIDIAVAMTTHEIATDTVREVGHHIAPGERPDMTRARVGPRRSGDLRRGAERRHPRDRNPQPARREAVRLHHGHRAAVRKLAYPRRRRPVRVPRRGRWVSRRRERGRCATPCDEHPLLAPARPGRVIPTRRPLVPPSGFERSRQHRNTTFEAWNLLHLAGMIRDTGGIRHRGSQRSPRDAARRIDIPNPGHRSRRGARAAGLPKEPRTPPCVLNPSWTAGIAAGLDLIPTRWPAVCGKPARRRRR